MSERHHVVIIGAGQAGLSAGYRLARAGTDFVILEAAERVGGSWRHRWDAMRLFTPSSHDGLPGTKFPAHNGYQFPSRDEMVTYLERYAESNALPVRTGVQVDGLFRDGDTLVVTAGAERYEADNVIVCVGAHRVPKVPDFAPQLDPGVTQMHSRDYRNPGSLRAGDVLIVGAGNSGADIALDVRTAGFTTYLSGEHPGQLPFRIEHARLLFPAIWFTWTHILNRNSPIGRRALPKIAAGAEPLIRVKSIDLETAGVQRLPRTTGVVGGLPQLADGRVLDVANVIWCTGFGRDHSWIALDGLDPAERLPNDRGVVHGQPGVYVLGQEFQFAFNSHTVGGVGRDAAYVAKHISRRAKAGRKALIPAAR